VFLIDVLTFSHSRPTVAGVMLSRLPNDAYAQQDAYNAIHRTGTAITIGTLIILILFLKRSRRNSYTYSDQQLVTSGESFLNLTHRELNTVLTSGSPY